MGKLRTLMQYAPKRIIALIAIAAAVATIPAVLFAWGPDRPTYTVENPASKVTFNSITNNPHIGDERNFVGIREAGSTGTWSDDISVQPGKEYVVRMYVHNNAAENLKLVAMDVTAKFNLPTTTAKSIQVNGFLSASNATPGEVYDHATFKSSKDFNLAYQAGTLKYYNNHFGSAGKTISESAFTNNGALLGYDKLDGEIPGCFQYAGYLTFTVKPQFAPEPGFTISKQVKKDGDSKFVESVEVKPGDTLKYRATFTNTGESQLKNVNLKDTLPQGISYVPGSVKIMNANNPNGASVPNGDNLFGNGINIGSYTAGSNAIVAYDAKVDVNDELPTCGENKLRNVVSAKPEGQNPKEDDAHVNVPKVCEEPEPKYTCDALTVTKITDTRFEFNTAYTVENASFKSVSYVIRDASGDEIARVAGPEYVQEAPGTYSVQAIVTVTVDGQDKIAPGSNCEEPFTVPEKPVEECKPGIPVGDPLCEDKVEECKPGIPVGDALCDVEEPCVPSNSSGCEEIPEELPTTGAGDSLIAFIGASSLVAAIGYYIASRRAIG